MLDQILATKKEELKTFQQPELISGQPHASLREALLNPNRIVGLIAEVKKASPSKGVFKETINPVAIAKSYEAAGADAISVLTDHTYFKGNREYLREIKEAVGLPILRKDFIIDERQIEESRRIGADAILLIAAAVSPKMLYHLYTEAYAVGLECLVEVHHSEELEKVLDVFQPEILGINNRNLNTFDTKIETTLDMLAFMPKGGLIVSESGFKKPQDVARILGRGINGILVGEALMTAETPEEGITNLLGGIVE